MKVGDLVRLKKYDFVSGFSLNTKGIVIRLVEQKHIDLGNESKIVDFKSAPMVAFAEVAVEDWTRKFKQEDLEVISESG